MGEPGPLDLSSNSRLEQVLADYSRRVAAGESISRDDLVSHHPGLADALRSHFASQAEIAEPDTSHGHEPDTSHGHDTAMSDPGTQYRPRSNQATIPPRLTPVRSCTLPEQFGRYRVVRCLGEGTMGAVYLADDTQLERPVALKIPKFTDEDNDEELSQRFYREARAAAHLRHANLCPVYDVGEIDGVRYLSMAYIEGRPLSEVLSEGGPLDSRAAVTFVLKLARALEAAHARSVIHRDLKPANIMIDAHQEPIIMDFGLARQMNKADSRLTQEGMLMGSPAYMSPEQVEGDTERMGPSCDIYSLGIILYELLTGEVPFKGSIAAVMGQILSSAPSKPSTIKRGIDPALEAVCLKMIAKRPEDRFASMTEVVRALDAYSAGRPTGVVLRDPDRTATMQALDALPAPGRGIVIQKWMLGVGLAIVIAGFGVTWALITFMMKHPGGPEEVTVSQQQKQAIDRGDAKVFINGNEVSKEELAQPIELMPGASKVEVREPGVDPTSFTIKVPEGDEQQNYLLWHDGKLTRKRHHRLVAEWVLSHGGKVTLAGSTDPLDNVEALPDGQLAVDQIDLQGVKQLPPFEIERISRISKLKRLVLPKSGVSKKQRDLLHAALPDCTIEPAA
jgi:tRNA A-37 threonylcarbamoyl transferase component Bud32